jgi:hypothetical protein
MKRIRRLIAALRPALVIAILAVWWWGQRGVDDGASAGSADAAPASPAVATASKAGAAADALAVARDGGESSAAASAGGRFAQAAAVPTQTPRRVARSAALSDTGPNPLSAEGQARIDAARQRLSIMDEDHREYALLASSEPPDPDWSPRLELLLLQAIDQHGRALTGLDASRPRCTRTVCVLTAASQVQETNHPNADWQRLVLRIMNEPWFREAFFDTSTTVTGDKQGTLYVTYFIRK